MKPNKKQWMQAAGLALTAAAAAAVSSYTTARFLSKVAMDREVPKVLRQAKHLISGSRKQVDTTDEKRELADRLAEKENEVVEIRSHDGVCLTGHWIAQAHPKRIIVAMHGWRSSWYWDFGMFSDFWEENGCSVLYAEQRAQGNSGGTYMAFGLEECYDCLDWVKWVSQHCGAELPVYLAGVSMGATTVLMASELDLPDNVHGILADCGFTSPHAIWKYVARENLHMGFGLRGRMADAIYHRRNPLRTALDSTVSALKKCRVPVFFAHGTDDRFVPVEMTYENYKACAAPKRLLIVPGATHGRSCLVDRPRYEAAVRSFWADFDANVPGKPDGRGSVPNAERQTGAPG